MTSNSSVYPSPRCLKMRADAVLSQANPVSGTKYTVLNNTANVRILQVGIWVTWTVQPTPLELHITIDGILHTFAITNPVSTTAYLPYMNHYAAATAQLLGASTNDYFARPFFIEGRNIKVEAETTGGTVQNLDARVKYATW